MEKFYASGRTFCVGANRNLKDIRTCRILLDRLIKDDYLSDDYLKERDRKKCKRMSDHAEAQNKQDIDLLFKIMNKKIRSWWD